MIPVHEVGNGQRLQFSELNRWAFNLICEKRFVSGNKRKEEITLDLFSRFQCRYAFLFHTLCVADPDLTKTRQCGRATGVVSYQQRTFTCVPEQSTEPAPPHSPLASRLHAHTAGVSVFTAVLVLWTVCLGGSHTHSEPRIVIIFSELLRTERQTEWVDRQMCTETDREREGSDWQQRGGLEAGPKIKTTQQVSGAGNKSSLSNSERVKGFNDSRSLWYLSLL